MTKPQIAMAIFFIIEFYATIYRCVKKDGNVFQAVTAAVVRVGLLIAILYCGGFWK